MNYNFHSFKMIFAALGCGAIIASCSNTNFSSGNGKPSPAQKPQSAPQTATPTPVVATPVDAGCVEGDKANLKWSGPVQECIEVQKKTYNFELKKCAEMPQATFSCSWDVVVAKLKSLELLTDAVQKASTDGSKLISCGQSKDGARIVVQWINKPLTSADLCNFNPETVKIRTGCYMNDAGPSAAVDPKTSEERDKIVYECMNQL